MGHGNIRIHITTSRRDVMGIMVRIIYKGTVPIPTIALIPTSDRLVNCCNSCSNDDGDCDIMVMIILLGEELVTTLLVAGLTIPLGCLNPNHQFLY